MQFTKPFKEKIRKGEQTLTFRRWKAPKARVGGVYRLHPVGGVRVTSVAVVDAGHITEDEAKRAGCASIKELMVLLSSASTSSPDEEGMVYRIAFEYVEEEDMPTKPALDIATIVAKLDGMDKRSTKPWAYDVLEAIAAHPERRAADLAEMLGLAKAPLKANVRKLKGLGLTQSLETGYRITELGRAVLTHSKARAAS